MRAMAAMSPGATARILTSLIAQYLHKKETPRRGAGASMLSSAVWSAAVAEQAQQHEEQVDEVEVETQRAHHRLAAGDATVVVDVVHLLDALRVVGGQADEDQHADHRDEPVEPARLQEDVDEAGDHKTDQAHEQKRAEAGQVTLRRVAVEAHRAE